MDGIVSGRSFLQQVQVMYFNKVIYYLPKVQLVSLMLHVCIGCSDKYMDVIIYYGLYYIEKFVASSINHTWLILFCVGRMLLFACNFCSVLVWLPSPSWFTSCISTYLNVRHCEMFVMKLYIRMVLFDSTGKTWF